MKFRSLIIFLSLLSALQCKGESAKRNDIDNVYKFIISFIKSQDKPSAVVTYSLCYESGEIVKLATYLSNIGTMFITVFNNKSKFHTKKHELIFLHDLNCLDSWTLLHKANERKLFARPYRWLIFNDNRTLSLRMTIYRLKYLNILPDSEVLIVDRVNCNMFQLLEVYKVSPTRELLQRPWGTWSHGVLHLNTHKETVERRRNLLRANITISNVITDNPNTVHHLEDAMEPEYDSLTKITYMVASLAIESLNGSIRVVFSPTWGYPNGYGNWSGMMTHLSTGQAVLGTSMLFTPERMAVVDYITMAVSTRVRFVLRQPPLSYVGNVYVLPLCPSTWAALGVVVVLAVLVLYIVATAEDRIGRRKSKKQLKHPPQLEGRLGDVMFLVISAVFQQGCGMESQRVAGRLASLVLFLSLMALYAAYSANIVVLLRSPSTSIRTLQDLLNSRITLATSNTTYNRYFFPSQKEPTRKAIYEKKIAPRGAKPRFLSMREGVQGIRKGLFAFHMEVNPGYRLIEETFFETEKCGLTEIDYLNVCDPWLPMEKESPYKELLKTKLMHVREVGLQSRISSLLVTPRPRCVGGLQAFSSVGIYDFYPVLLFMLYGFAFAGIVFLAELFVYKRIHTKRYLPSNYFLANHRNRKMYERKTFKKS